jgi:PIN domain nuclease of toxin-antitoxin system
MRLLLDTCMVYDWLMGEITDSHVLELIQIEGALVSVVSVWEMAIKNSLGKMPLPSNGIEDDIEAPCFQLLNITPYYAQALLLLGAFHKDPFDRLLGYGHN